MAYHIAGIGNASDRTCATTNPAASRDNYVIDPYEIFVFNYPVEINTPNDSDSTADYCHALLWANFLYTGVYDYCFWDTGADAVVAVTQQDPTTNSRLYHGPATKLILIVKDDGSIALEELDKFDKSKFPKLR